MKTEACGRICWPPALAAVRNAVVGLLHLPRLPNLAAARRSTA